MNHDCANCGALVQHNAPKHGKPASWQCARCERAGAYVSKRVLVGTRIVTVTVRDVTSEGDPAMRRDWVPAESLPYVERVS